MTNFSIKIISDIVCPFCYVGKRRLENAIEVFKTTPGAAQDTFKVTWQPYYLDPSSPKEGVPVKDAMARKFGGSARVEGMLGHMKQMGASLDIDFTWKGLVGNTRDAHRLVQLAKAKDEKSSSGDEVQNRLMASLFRSYFEEGGDVTSHEMLVSAAERAGLDGAEARDWLATGKGGKEVDAEVQNAYAKGVRGVPHFIINDEFEVGGAQDVGVFLEEFVRAKSADGKKQGRAVADSSVSC